jgi:hypothetical protein
MTDYDQAQGSAAGAASGGAMPAPVVRRYRGNSRSASEAFQVDAASMASAGWYPTTQTYVPGQWGCGAWVIAFVLLVFVIGILVLAYMIAVRPDGELIVTYESRGPQPGSAQPAATATATPATPAGETPAATETAASPDPVEQLRRLGELRDAGLITPDEFEAKKTEILGRL